MRRIVPILLFNVVVIGIVTAVIVTYPEYTRIAALAMPVLLVLNFMFFRRLQRKTAEDIATGKAAPPSSDKKKKAMWILALYGAASYVSGAFNIPELLQKHESAMWLGWAVKMGMGTLCIWCAYKVQKSLKEQSSDPAQK